jgi:hypothetical protein
MAYDRNLLLDDLVKGVIEVTLSMDNNPSGVIAKCTLKPENMPYSYRNSPEEQQKVLAYHQEHAKLVASWELKTNAWIHFNIDRVVYCQSLDGF